MFRKSAFFPHLRGGARLRRLLRVPADDLSVIDSKKSERRSLSLPVALALLARLK